MLRISAAASFSTLVARVSSRSAPVDETGVAAPMLDPGAITAKFAAAVRNVPADPACAPWGETYTTTGRGAASSRSTMSRVAPSMPPGVSSLMTSTVAPVFSASPIARRMYRSLTGLITPSIVITSACGPSPPWAIALPATGPKMPARIASAERVSTSLRRASRVQPLRTAISLLFHFIRLCNIDYTVFPGKDKSPLSNFPVGRPLPGGLEIRFTFWAWNLFDRCPRISD